MYFFAKMLFYSRLWPVEAIAHAMDVRFAVIWKKDLRLQRNVKIFLAGHVVLKIIMYSTKYV